MSAGSDWRVSDAEREAVATALGLHLAAGRLTTDEFRTRLEAVYAATTAADLAKVSADLPAAGPSGWGERAGGSPGEPGPGGTGGAPGLRRALTRVLAFGALLVTIAVAGTILLITSLAGHGSLLIPALVLLAVPVLLAGAVSASLVWVGRRAWRSGAWLEVVPAAAGAPWLGRALWATRALLVGRVFWRIASRLGRPVRSRQRRVPRPAGQGAWYQAEPGGDWRAARVDDVRGPAR